MKKNDQMLADDAVFSSKPTLKDRLKSQGFSCIALAALIPALLFLLIYLVRGQYPFGDETVLVLDLNGQYVYFFGALRNTVLEGGSLLYSWSRSMGGEFIGMYAYYLASPLSYLVCLFPEERIQEFLLLLFMIKAAFCGGTMAFYLKKHSINMDKLTIIAFSVMYAMSAYCVVQQSNTMWIDAVMWLPLVICGLEELIRHGKYKMFVIFLALTLASNFYIGYMVCIFVLLYFFFYNLAHKDDGENNPCSEEKHFLKSFIRVACFSLLAVGIAMVLLLSAYYSLQFGKNEFSNTNWDVALRIDFFDILFKMLPSSYDTVRIDGLPFIYCGILTAILAQLFFCCKKISTREKILSGIMIAVFVLSFMITVLDLVWHGFQKPQWLNNRYSFIFCFFLISIAFKAFERIEHVGKQSIACVTAFIFMVAAIVQCFAGPYKDKLVALKYGPQEEKFVIHEYATVLLTVVCLAIYVVILILTARNQKRGAISGILLSVVCIEVFLSGLCNVIDFDKDVTFTNYHKYSEYQELFTPATDTLHAFDASLYRSEKTHYRTSNDNMELGLRGLSGSTSTLNKSTIYFLHQMGYLASSHKSYYKGGNAVGDSLLGIKYLVSDQDLSNLYGEPVLTGEDFAAHMGMTVEELAEATATSKDLYKNLDATMLNVYLNQYALSLAFASGSGIYDINMKNYGNDFVDAEKYPEKYADIQNPDGYKNPFDRMNAIVTAILGEEETVEIFKPATLVGDPVLSEGVTTREYREHIEYKKNGGTITYTYDVPENVELYLYFPTYFNRKVDISSPTMPIFDETIKAGWKVDGIEKPDYCNDRLFDLGFSTATKYSLKVKINNTTQDGTFVVLKDTSYVYYLDKEVLEDAFSRIQAEQLIIDEDYKDDDFSGTITTLSDNRTIMTSIAYDEGWKVYVDGKQVEIKEALGALISFEIEDAGEHTLRLVYSPITYNAGLVITVVSCAAFVAIIILEKYWKRIGFIKSVFVVEEPKELPSQEDKKRVKSNKTKD